ncbi:MAG: DUF2703 domain-containing protein [Rhodospirillaceae bacterium]
MSDSGCKPARRTVAVDLLYIDIQTCDRCQGAAKHLDQALTAVRPLLDLLGIDVTVTETLIDSAEKAEAWRLVSSPTVRIDGRDIQATLSESACGACSSLIPAGAVDCREWPWRGQVHSSPPAGMLAEAIVRAALDDGPAEPDNTVYTLPSNLRRFFSSGCPTGCC